MKTWKTAAVAMVVAILMSATARASTDAWGDEGSESKSSKSARISEREADLYQDGMDAIDDEEWEEAVRTFSKCAELKGKRADGALYWTAYALNKEGNKDQALQVIAALKKNYPKSEWIDDADALSVEVRERRGVRVQPSEVSDEEVKLMAIHSLMNTDPERAFPLLEKILKGTSSKKMKEQAMFVLSQSSSAKAQQLIASLAKGGGSAELQKQAVHYLGIAGGQRNRGLLLEVYNSTKSRDVKEEVLNALMIAGDRAGVLNAAKNESDSDLREEAIRLLGVMGARNDLAAMWATETSPNAREAIIDAFFVAGDIEHINEIAKNDRNPETRAEAIRKLGLMGKRTAPMLLAFFAESNPDIKEAVLDALFVQGNARALIDLAKKETNRSMKREILQKLSVMGNKEAIDYMLELLNED